MYTVLIYSVYVCVPVVLYRVRYYSAPASQSHTAPQATALSAASAARERER